MANICDNKLYFSCESNFEKYKMEFEDLLEEELDGDITVLEFDESGRGSIELMFDSKWTFPAELFRDLFPGDDLDEVYIRCLSEEYGCGYVAMNIYSNGEWREEQCFDI